MANAGTDDAETVGPPSRSGSSDNDEVILIELDESDNEEGPSELAARPHRERAQNYRPGPSTADSESEDESDDSSAEAEEITIIELSDTEINKSDFSDIDIKSEPEDDYEDAENFNVNDLGIVVTETQLPDSLLRDPINGVYRCKFCPKKFKSRPKQISHVQDHIKRGTLLKCHFCDYFTALNHKLVEHERIHTQEKPYQCDTCGYRCRLKGDLTKHMTTHSNYRKYKCQICPYKAKLAGALKKHMEKHDPHMARNFICTLCGFAFKRQSHLNDHMRRRHNDSKPFFCDDCDYTCKTNWELNSHMAKHSDDRPFICPEPGCKRTYKTRSDMTKHVKWAHRNIKNYVCSICGKRFVDGTRLKKHADAHTDIRNFECGECMKKYKTLGTLQKHMVTHQLIKPFKCEICFKMFASTSNMKTHQEVHAKDRPLQCPICVHGSKEMDHLLTHVGTEHLGMFTYMCSLCRKPFGKSYPLLFHFQRCHKAEMKGKEEVMKYDPNYLDLDLKSDLYNLFDPTTYAKYLASEFLKAVVKEEQGGEENGGAEDSGVSSADPSTSGSNSSLLTPDNLKVPPVVQIARYGGIPVLLVRKSSGIKLNFDKKGKKPKHWFMDTTFMNPADAERHREFLFKKEHGLLPWVQKKRKLAKNRMRQEEGRRRVKASMQKKAGKARGVGKPRGKVKKKRREFYTDEEEETEEEEEVYTEEEETEEEEEAYELARQLVSQLDDDVPFSRVSGRVIKPVVHFKNLPLDAFDPAPKPKQIKKEPGTSTSETSPSMSHYAGSKAAVRTKNKNIVKKKVMKKKVMKKKVMKKKLPTKKTNQLRKKGFSSLCKKVASGKVGLGFRKPSASSKQNQQSKKKDSEKSDDLGYLSVLSSALPISHYKAAEAAANTECWVNAVQSKAARGQFVVQPLREMQEISTESVDELERDPKEDFFARGLGLQLQPKKSVSLEIFSSSSTTVVLSQESSTFVSVSASRDAAASGLISAFECRETDQDSSSPRSRNLFGSMSVSCAEGSAAIKHETLDDDTIFQANAECPSAVVDSVSGDAVDVREEDNDCSIFQSAAECLDAIVDAIVDAKPANSDREILLSDILRVSGECLADIMAAVSAECLQNSDPSQVLEETVTVNSGCLEEEEKSQQDATETCALSLETVRKSESSNRNFEPEAGVENEADDILENPPQIAGSENETGPILGEIVETPDFGSDVGNSDCVRSVENYSCAAELQTASVNGQTSEELRNVDKNSVGLDQILKDTEPDSQNATQLQNQNGGELQNDVELHNSTELQKSASSTELQNSTASAELQKDAELQNDVEPLNGTDVDNGTGLQIQNGADLSSCEPSPLKMYGSEEPSPLKSSPRASPDTLQLRRSSKDPFLSFVDDSDLLNTSSDAAIAENDETLLGGDQAMEESFSLSQTICDGKEGGEETICNAKVEEEGEGVFRQRQSESENSSPDVGGSSASSTPSRQRRVRRPPKKFADEPSPERISTAKRSASSGYNSPHPSITSLPQNSQEACPQNGENSQNILEPLVSVDLGISADDFQVVVKEEDGHSKERGEMVQNGLDFGSQEEENQQQTLSLDCENFHEENHTESRHAANNEFSQCYSKCLHVLVSDVRDHPLTDENLNAFGVTNMSLAIPISPRLYECSSPKKQLSAKTKKQPVSNKAKSSTKKASSKSSKSTVSSKQSGSQKKKMNTGASTLKKTSKTPAKKKKSAAKLKNLTKKSGVSGLLLATATGSTIAKEPPVKAPSKSKSQPKKKSSSLSVVSTKGKSAPSTKTSSKNTSKSSAAKKQEPSKKATKQKKGAERCTETVIQEFYLPKPEPEDGEESTKDLAAAQENFPVKMEFDEGAYDNNFCVVGFLETPMSNSELFKMTSPGVTRDSVFSTPSSKVPEEMFSTPDSREEREESTEEFAMVGTPSSVSLTSGRKSSSANSTPAGSPKKKLTKSSGKMKSFEKASPKSKSAKTSSRSSKKSLQYSSSESALENAASDSASVLSQLSAASTSKLINFSHLSAASTPKSALSPSSSTAQKSQRVQIMCPSPAHPYSKQATVNKKTTSPRPQTVMNRRVILDLGGVSPNDSSGSSQREVYIEIISPASEPFTQKWAPHASHPHNPLDTPIIRIEERDKETAKDLAGEDNDDAELAVWNSITSELQTQFAGEEEKEEKVVADSSLTNSDVVQERFEVPPETELSQTSQSNENENAQEDVRNNTEFNSYTGQSPAVGDNSDIFALAASEIKESASGDADLAQNFADARSVEGDHPYVHISKLLQQTEVSQKSGSSCPSSPVNTAARRKAFSKKMQDEIERSSFDELSQSPSSADFDETLASSVDSSRQDNISGKPQKDPVCILQKEPDLRGMKVKLIKKRTSTTTTESKSDVPQGAKTARSKTKQSVKQQKSAPKTVKEPPKAESSKTALGNNKIAPAEKESTVGVKQQNPTPVTTTAKTVLEPAEAESSNTVLGYSKTAALGKHPPNAKSLNAVSKHNKTASSGEESAVSATSTPDRHQRVRRPPKKFADEPSPERISSPSAKRSASGASSPLISSSDKKSLSSVTAKVPKEKLESPETKSFVAQETNSQIAVPGKKETKASASRKRSSEFVSFEEEPTQSKKPKQASVSKALAHKQPESKTKQVETAASKTTAKSAVSNTTAKSAVGNTTAKSAVSNTATAKFAVGNTTAKSAVSNTTSKSAVGNTTAKSAVGNATSKSAVGNTTAKSAISKTAKSAVTKTTTAKSVSNTTAKSAVSNTTAKSAVSNTTAKSAVSNTTAKSAIGKTTAKPAQKHKPQTKVAALGAKKGGVGGTSEHQQKSNVSSAASSKNASKRSNNSAFKIIKMTPKARQLVAEHSGSTLKRKRCLYVEAETGRTPELPPPKKKGRQPGPKIVIDRTQLDLCYDTEEPITESESRVSENGGMYARSSTVGAYSSPIVEAYSTAYSTFGDPAAFQRVRSFGPKVVLRPIPVIDPTSPQGIRVVSQKRVVYFTQADGSVALVPVDSSSSSQEDVKPDISQINISQVDNSAVPESSDRMYHVENSTLPQSSGHMYNADNSAPEISDENPMPQTSDHLYHVENSTTPQSNDHMHHVETSTAPHICDHVYHVENSTTQSSNHVDNSTTTSMSDHMYHAPNVSSSEGCEANDPAFIEVKPLIEELAFMNSLSEDRPEVGVAGSNPASVSVMDTAPDSNPEVVNSDCASAIMNSMDVFVNEPGVTQAYEQPMPQWNIATNTRLMSDATKAAASRPYSESTDADTGKKRRKKDPSFYPSGFSLTPAPSSSLIRNRPYRRKKWRLTEEQIRIAKNSDEVERGEAEEDPESDVEFVTADYSHVDLGAQQQSLESLRLGTFLFDEIQPANPLTETSESNNGPKQRNNSGRLETPPLGLDCGVDGNELTFFPSSQESVPQQETTASGSDQFSSSELRNVIAALGLDSYEDQPALAEKSYPSPMPEDPLASPEVPVMRLVVEQNPVQFSGAENQNFYVQHSFQPVVGGSDIENVQDMCNAEGISGYEHQNLYNSDQDFEISGVYSQQLPNAEDIGGFDHQNVYSSNQNFETSGVYSQQLPTTQDVGSYDHQNVYSPHQDFEMSHAYSPHFPIRSQATNPSHVPVLQSTSTSLRSDHIQVPIDSHSRSLTIYVQTRDGRRVLLHDDNE